MPFQDLGVGRNTVTVTGAPEIRSPTDFQYSSNTPSGSSGGGFSPLGNLFTALSNTVSGVASAATGSSRGDQPNTRSPTISTASVDGQSGFVNGLSDRIRGVLDTIGSVGDGLAQIQSRTSAPQPMQASYGGGGGQVLNPTVILAVMAVAGVIYVATKD